VPKTKKFIPLQSQRQDDEKSETHQLAKLLVTTGILESPDALVPLAISQSVDSFLLHRLAETQTNLQDYTQIQTLKTNTRDNMVLHLIQERAMLTVNQALTQANINCIWLNGKALGYMIYPEPHLRVTDTVECIIAPDNMPSVVKLLQSIGYYQPDSAHDSYHQSVQLYHRQHAQLRLVLHEQLKGYSGRALISDERLAQWFDDPLQFKVKEQNLITLQPEHHLLYLCANGFLHDGQSIIGLHDLLDLHLLLTTVDLNWDGLIAEAVELQWTYLVAYVFDVVCDYFDTPISTDVLAALHKQNKADQFMRRIVLNYHDDSQAESVFQYMGQLGIRDKIKTAVQIFFPPKRYIRQRYSIRAKRATAPYYVYRILSYLITMPIKIIRRVLSLLKRAFRRRNQSNNALKRS